MDTFLTVDEAARALRVSRATVYKRIATGAVRAVRLGDGPKAPLRIAEDELDRYTRASTIGNDIAAQAEKLVALRGEAGDARAYARALQDLGYEAEVFADRVRHMVHGQVEEAHRRGYLATAAASGSDAVDIEGIVREELAKLGRPLPPQIASLGPSGLGKSALRILRETGATEFDERAYRTAIRQAIKDAVNPQRKV